MNQSESIGLLTPAFIKACSEMGIVNESEQVNYGNHFKYATLEDYLDVISPVLEANGLCVVASNSHVIQLDPRPTKSGGIEYAVQVELTMTLLHSSGEYIQINVYGQAQDVGDKAVFQAITGARKYGNALLFNLVTSDDPERAGEKGVGKKQEAGKKSTGKKQESEGKKPELEPKPKSDPADVAQFEIRDRLFEMYGSGNYIENLVRLTEFEGNSGHVDGVQSLADSRLTAGRLATLRGKVSKEYTAWKKGQSK